MLGASASPGGSKTKRTPEWRVLKSAGHGLMDERRVRSSRQHNGGRERKTVAAVDHVRPLPRHVSWIPTSPHYLDLSSTVIVPGCYLSLSLFPSHSLTTMRAHTHRGYP